MLGLLVKLTSPLIHQQCEIDGKKQQVLILQATYLKNIFVELFPKYLKDVMIIINYLGPAVQKLVNLTIG